MKRGKADGQPPASDGIISRQERAILDALQSLGESIVEAHSDGMISKRDMEFALGKVKQMQRRFGGA
jgi:hypothetical protein